MTLSRSEKRELQNKGLGTGFSVHEFDDEGEECFDADVDDDEDEFDENEYDEEPVIVYGKGGGVKIIHFASSDEINHALGLR